LRFDGFPIDQCGLKAPSLDRCDHGGKQVRGTIDGPDGLDLAVFGDSGMDANVLTRASGKRCELRVDAGNQSPDNYFCSAIEGPVRIPR
jgi:hypothetical protein